MRIKTLRILTFSSFAVFAICGYLGYEHSAFISTSIVGTYAFLGAAAVSMLIWPVFFIKWVRAELAYEKQVPW